MRGQRVWKISTMACTALAVAMSGLSIRASEKDPKGSPTSSIRSGDAAVRAEKSDKANGIVKNVDESRLAKDEPSLHANVDRFILAFQKLESRGFEVNEAIGLQADMQRFVKANPAYAASLAIYIAKLESAINAPPAVPVEPSGSVAGGSNEDCPQATAINCGDSILDIDMTAAGGFTSQYGATTVSCTTFTAAGPDVVYSFSVLTAQTVTVDMADVNVFDASLYVVTDCSNINGSCVVGSDECTPSCGGGEEQVVFVATPGNTYFIIADSFTSAPGAGSNFDLTVTCAAPPACGDGIVDIGEGCDDGNVVSNDGCSATCVDEGACCLPNGTCTANITSADCTATPGADWQGQQTVCGVCATCGDGVVGAGEQCDDSNLVNGDGCSSICIVEAPANDTCAGTEALAPLPDSDTESNVGAIDDATGTCGVSSPNQAIWYTVTGTGNTMTATTDNVGTTYDTLLQVFCGSCATPICIGGDDDAGTGTTSLFSWCSEAGSTYYIVVGGFSTNTGTSVTSASDSGIACVGAISCTVGVCGDGALNAGEACDDGNLVNHDGCSSTCTEEGACCKIDGTCISNRTTVECSTAGGNYQGDNSVCAPGLCPACGDGIIEAPEQCDDGNTVAGDGCDGNCQCEAIVGVPANDACVGRINVTDGSYCFDVDNATTDGIDEPTCAFPFGSDDIIHLDIWYNYQATCTGVLVVDTCDGTSSDTRLAAYAGWACPPAGAPIDCDDDDEDGTNLCGGSLESVLLIPVTLGDQLKIRVGLFSATSTAGLDTLRIDCQVVVCGNGTVEIGEQCDDGNVVSGDGCSSTCQDECGSGVVTGTEECDDGNLVSNDGCSATCLDEGACCEPDGTCTPFVTETDCVALPGIYQGDQVACGAVTCPVCGNGAVEAPEECDDGNLVNGDGCDSLCQVEAPANDLCTGDISVSLPGSGPVQSNVGGTDDGTATCGVSSPNQGLWYSVLGNGNTITVTTCNAPTTDYDTMIQVWCDCPALLCVGGNDDQAVSSPSCETTGVVGTNRGSTVSFCSLPGQTYYVVVGGFSTSTGNHQLDASENGIACTPTVSCAPPVCGNGLLEAGEECDDGNVANGDGCDSLCQFEPPANDDCIDRITITDGAYNFNNSDATTDGEIEAVCNFAFGDDQIHNDIWYNYQATCTGTLVIDTCAGGSFDTRLAVYDGWDCPLSAEDPLDCDDDDDDLTDLCGGSLESALVLAVTTGQQLKIRVGEFSATSGSGADVLTVSCAQCGNGTVESGEQCDDGNVVSGDGCTASCQLEGACCIPGSCTCSSLTGAACTTAGGLFRGNGVTCASVDNCDCNNNNVCDHLDFLPSGGILQDTTPDLAVPDNGATTCPGTPCAVGQVCVDTNGLGTANRCGVSDTLVVAASAVITDLDVGINIAHTWEDDLIVILEKDGTTRANLLNSLGDGDDLDGLYVFDDEASTTLHAAGSGGAVPQGVYLPDESLAVFNGLNQAGIWTLYLVDTVGSDTGTLRSWTLFSPAGSVVTSQDCNGNGVPDECELAGNDCNSNNIPDDCELDPGCLSQLPNASNGIFSDVDCDFCGADPLDDIQILADQFVVAAPDTLKAIRFWGSYFPDNLSSADSFTVILRSDTAALPDAVVATLVSGAPATTKVDTGVVLPFGVGINRYEYTIDVADTALAAGTYWIEIYNDTAATTDSWAWEAGNLDAVDGIAGQAFTFTSPEAPWTFDGTTDMAVQLICGSGNDDDPFNGILDECEGGCPCVTVSDCKNSLCADDNACNCATCTAGVCVFTCTTFGNTNCSGLVTLDDILCVLAGFASFPACPNGDISPCGGNGIINLDDILQVLNAFGGGNPCGCQPAGTPALCGSSQP